MDRDDVIALIRQLNQQNYSTGAPRIDPHNHDGINSPKLSTLSSGSGLNGFQVFTASGTFTPPSGFTKFLVKLQAPGGGAGGPNDTAASGAGAGAYAEKLCTLTTTTSITIGAIGTGGTNGAGTDGGTTSFGSLFSVGGGKKGGATNTPGLGGTATGGDMNIAGQDGTAGYTIGTTTVAISGQGGDSILGFGGPNVSAVGSGLSAGINGKGYGGGGSGGAEGPTGVGFPKGGDGAPSIALILW